MKFANQLSDKLQTNRILIYSFCMLLLMIIYSGSLQAQPGSLDLTFGSKGKIVNETFGDAYSSALQEDGKIILAGLAYEEVAILVRYNHDGSLDETFGDHGKILTDLAADYNFYYSQARAVAVQADSKIIIAGTGYFENDNGDADYDVLLIRYNADGSLDESFGDGGIVINDFSSDRDIAYDITLQPDGKIIIAGMNYPYMLIARYLSDGRLDNSFNSKGWTSLTDGGKALSIALQPDGKIVAGGEKYFTVNSYILARLEANGTPDQTFGINGIVSSDVGDDEYVNDILIQKDMKIVAAGKSKDYDLGYYDNISMARYEPNGNFDSSFGVNGKVITAIQGKDSRADKLIIDEINNKIIVSGTTGDFLNSTSSDFILIRYNKDGSINDNFGENGIQLTDFGALEYCQGSLFQPDGKIILTGVKGNYGFALARYNGNEAETPQITRIKKWLHRHGFTWNDFPRKKATRFKVERSMNGTSFYPIASIAGNLSQQQYNYEDPAPLAGMNYYRLTVISEDGSTVQSNILAMDNSESAIRLYPNPIKNSVQIEGLPAHQPTKLRITDASGIIRAATTITSSNYNWNIAQLAPGNYILTINTGAGTVARNIIKE